MKSKTRATFSITVSQFKFLKKYAQTHNIHQSYVVSQAINIFQKLQEDSDLKNAYIDESNIKDNFTDKALEVYYNDFPNDN